LVKQETLEWLAKSKRFTKRFEKEIGSLCQEMTVKRVAAIYHLSWDQVRRMEMEYLREKIGKYPISEKLRAIGIDEVSIRKRHKYAIVVADLDAKRPIWLGTSGRKKEDLDEFYKEIGAKRVQGIQLAVMDMWKPFYKSTRQNAPQSKIIYDKFHIIRHLGKALDAVRRSEYKRVNESERRFIKGQRFTLLTNRENLNTTGRESLRLLLKANKRIYKAYVLKESFGQLWDYKNAVWSRKFFDNWKNQLRWSGLESYKKFSETIDRHWDHIASYCDPNNKVSLGFMEGLNNKIRVIQRRAYGIKNDEYLRLKVIASFLPND
jgi:transposase